MKIRNFIMATYFTSLVSVLSMGLSVLAEDSIQPDNSKMNATEHDTSKLNAQDQGSSDTDIGLTRTIRKQVVATKALSMNAKNIKIITVNGVVTLKGPVNSVGEKARIEKIARNVAGKDRVVSEIEVKVQ
jgi:hyperosmotically inducible periplasmic protein